MLSLDLLAHTGPLRSRAAIEKIGPGLGLVAVALAFDPVPTALIIITITTGLALFVAQISVARWLRALSLPAGFIVTGALGVMLVGGDGPGPLPLTIEKASFEEGLDVLLRSVAGTSAVILIGATTPMVDIIALLRRLRVPAVVTDQMASIYRLVFDLIDTGRRIRLSQVARLGHDGFRRSVRSSGTLAGAVFVHGIHRAKRLQVGLDARGYDGELRVMRVTKPVDAAWLAVGLLVVVVAAVSGPLLRGVT
ncbi:MAG: cobalt ECF transporter T component CbiQ [Actinomycetota bacterium]